MPREGHVQVMYINGDTRGGPNRPQWAEKGGQADMAGNSRLKGFKRVDYYLQHLF